MKTLKILSVAAVCLAFAGSCAANTNNGGHVVGNPIISEGASKKMAEKDCDCSNPKVAKTCHCPAPKKGDSKGVKPCTEGETSCKKE